MKLTFDSYTQIKFSRKENSGKTLFFMGVFCTLQSILSFAAFVREVLY